MSIMMCPHCDEQYDSDFNASHEACCEEKTDNMHSPLWRKVHKETHTTHDKSTSREYGIWSAMKNRCDNPSHIGYKNYDSSILQPRYLEHYYFLNTMLDVHNEQGSTAADFIPRLVAKRNILIDKGICPKCHGNLLVSWEKFGFTEISMTKVIISCPRCGYEPKE